MKLVASSSSGCARSARPLAKPASNMTTNLGLSACFSRKSVAMKAQFESYNTTKTTEAPQDDGGFFSSAFKDALATAIERSDDSTLSFASPNTLSKPAYVAPPEPSAQEDMLAAALEASKTSVSRLLAIRNEIERSLEREKMQVERLEFALDKAKKDEAYYRVLKVLQDRGASDLEE